MLLRGAHRNCTITHRLGDWRRLGFGAGSRGARGSDEQVHFERLVCFVQVYRRVGHGAHLTEGWEIPSVICV